MKIENLCIHCMQEKNNASEICPFCGFDPKTAEIPPYHLQPFSILAGKYLLGMAIGEGGFGITYIGMDLNLEMKVAIKEYYPNGCATRNRSESNTVISYSSSMHDIFEEGREKFINEARLLAKCNNLPEIVSVKDFFKENHTAYIVMEYINGMTLKSYLKQNGGKLSAQKTLQMMKPVIHSLAKVHDMNLIHRDISPDNIMLCKDGAVKILDFGGARDYIFSTGKSMSIMLKPGYTPEEQYRAHGNQGPWTDVYALCATMYRCITGTIPPESLERAYHENLQPIWELASDCPPAAAYAIEKGMSIHTEDRFQSMQKLYSALYESENFTEMPKSAPKPPSTPARSDDNKKPKPKKKCRGLKVILILCILVIIFMWVMYLTHDQTISINISAQNETSDFIENCNESQDFTEVYNASSDFTVTANFVESDIEEDVNVA